MIWLEQSLKLSAFFKHPRRTLSIDRKHPKSSAAMLSIAEAAKISADKFLQQSIECFATLYGEDHSALADVMTTASALKVGGYYIHIQIHIILCINMLIVTNMHTFIRNSCRNIIHMYVTSMSPSGKLWTFFRCNRVGRARFSLSNRDNGINSRQNC